MKLGKNIRVNTHNKIWSPVYESTIESVNDSVFCFKNKDYSVWWLIVYPIYDAITTI